MAAVVVGVTALVVRFARSSGEERLQLKWFAAAALLVVVTLIASFVTNAAVANVLSNLAFVCLFAAIAIAVLKYRLYDIDIVISKAVLYGSLAVFITAVYAALVVGIGTLAGNPRSPLLTALAAAVVAVAFQPARQWAGRLANRVVYGRRATPYQVLSDFARRIGGTYAAEDVLPQMAQIVAAGTGAKTVVIWLRVGDELHPEASSDGNPREGPLPVDGQVLPPLPDAEISVPVVHQGELLGAISITMPKDEPLRPAGQQLVTDVASQAGLALANAGLIEDLRASRQRLVTAQDEARRRLERNIHDGAQQDLVALAIKLQLAETTVAADPAQTGPVFGELKADAAGALENLRDLARGIYPPLLADLGLAAALNAQASKSPAAGDGRSRRDRAIRPRHRGGGVFLLPGGAAEHRQIRPRHPGPDLPASAQRNPAVHRVRRRDRLRHPPHPAGLRAAQHGRPARRTQRPARDPVRPPPGHHHHRAPPRHAVTSRGISAQHSHPAEATTA